MQFNRKRKVYPSTAHWVGHVLKNVIELRRLPKTSVVFFSQNATSVFEAEKSS